MVDRIRLSFNTMAADGLVMQVAGASTTMVLTRFSQNIPVLTLEGLLSNL